jgi:hypothetical protein
MDDAALEVDAMKQADGAVGAVGAVRAAGVVGEPA